ncbi:MAG: translocation/assembly module TamB domain-containing protein [Alphaproteobacteria bacterium]
MSLTKSLLRTRVVAKFVAAMCFLVCSFAAFGQPFVSSITNSVDGRVKVDINAGSRTKNDAVFDSNFADFDKLALNSLLQEQVQIFLAFTTNLDIQIESVSGDLATSLDIKNIVGTKDGLRVLEIGRASIECDISEIALGRLVINRLLLDQVSVKGGWTQDASSGLEIESPNAKPKPAFKILGFEVPRLPISLFVSNFLVRNLSLTKEVMGQDMAVDMAGRINIPNGQAPVDTDFEIIRRDDVRGRVQAQLIWQPETSYLALILGSEESANGFIQEVLNLDKSRRYETFIRGQGPINNWQSEILFELEDSVSINGRMRVDTSNNSQKVLLSGQADFLKDTKRLYPRLTQDPVRLDIDARYKTGERFQLNGFSIKSNLLDVIGQGWIEPESKDSQFQLGFRSKNSDAFKDFAPSLTLTGLAAKLNIERRANAASLLLETSIEDGNWQETNSSEPDFSFGKVGAQFFVKDLTQSDGWLNSFQLGARGQLDTFSAGEVLSLQDGLTFKNETFITDMEGVGQATGKFLVNNKNLNFVGAFASLLPSETESEQAGGFFQALQKIAKLDAKFEAGPTLPINQKFIQQAEVQGNVTLENNQLNSKFTLNSAEWEDPTLNGLIGETATVELSNEPEENQLYNLSLSAENLDVSARIQNGDVSGDVQIPNISKLDGASNTFKGGKAKFAVEGTLATPLRLALDGIFTNVTYASKTTRNLFGDNKDVTFFADLTNPEARIFSLENMQLSSPTFDFDGTATIPVKGKIQVQGEGSVRPTTSLLDLNKNSDETSPSQGQSFKGSLSATGRKGFWDIDISSRLGAVFPAFPEAVKYFSADQDLTLSLQIENKKAKLRNLRVLGGSIEVDIQQTNPDAYVGSANIASWKQVLPQISDLDGLGGEVQFEANLSDDGLQGFAQTVLENTGVGKPSKLGNKLTGLALYGSFASGKDKSITLSGLNAKLKGSEINADAKVDAKGQLEFANANIPHFGLQLLNEQLKGKLFGSLQIKGQGDGGYSVQHDLEIEKLAVLSKPEEDPLLKIEQTNIVGLAKLYPSDMFKKSRTNASIDMVALEFGEQKFAKSRLVVDGAANRLAFDLASHGLPQLETSGVFGFTDGFENLNSFDLRLDKLRSKIGQIDIHAVQPVYLRQSKDQRLLTANHISVAEGKLNTTLLVENGVVGGDISFQNNDLSVLEDYDGFKNVGGSVQMNVKVSGPANNPSAIGSVRLKDLKIVRENDRIDDLKGELPELQGRGTLGLNNQVFWFDSQLVGPRGLLSEINLSFPVKFDFEKFSFGVSPKTKLNGTLNGKFDAVEIGEYLALDGDEIGGQVNFQSKIAGTLQKPDFRGSFALKDGRYENEKTGFVLDDLQILGRAEGDSLVFKSENQSRVSVNGRVDLKPNLKFPVSVVMKTRRANLVNRDDASMLLSSYIRLEGALAGTLRLVGDVVVDEAEVRMPDIRQNNIVKLDVVEINRPTSLAPLVEIETKSQILTASVRIRSQANLNFRGAGVDTNWGLGLQVEGPINEPLLTGTLWSSSGGLTLLGKRFKLTRGEVSFNEEGPTDPRLELLLERDTDNLLVQISVTGTVQNPVVEIRSVPDLPTDQIVSQLLFSQDPRQLDGIQAVELVTALTRLQNFGRSEDFVERMRSLTGLDSLTFAANDDNETAIRAGKDINKDWEVWVEQGFRSGSTRVGTNYQFSPDFGLRSDYGIDQNGKVVLDWSFEY